MAAPVEALAATSECEGSIQLASPLATHLLDLIASSAEVIEHARLFCQPSAVAPPSSEE